MMAPTYTVTVTEGSHVTHQAGKKTLGEVKEIVFAGLDDFAKAADDLEWQAAAQDVRRWSGQTSLHIHVPRWNRSGTSFSVSAVHERSVMDPVGIVEIADRLQMARSTVDQWATRGLLPERDWTVGGRPAWRWATIREWAARTGRLP